MFVLALASIIALALTVVVFANLLRIERRQSSRDRDLLLNQLLHAFDRPWQPAPSSAAFDDDEPEPEPRETVALPEQYGDEL